MREGKFVASPAIHFDNVHEGAFVDFFLHGAPVAGKVYRWSDSMAYKQEERSNRR